MAGIGRVLIAFASRAGSTMGVAVHIAETLAKRGVTVDIAPVEGAPEELTPYRAVILGSPIRFGHLPAETMAFIQQHREYLVKKPFYLFVMSRTLAKGDAESRRIVEGCLEPARALVQPASVGLFAGVVEYSRLNLMERLWLKLSHAKEGDFRQWEEIDAWVKGLEVE